MKRAVILAVVALLAIAVALRWPTAGHHAPLTLIGLSPSQVNRLTVTSAGQQREFLRGADGSWRPNTSASTASAALLDTAENRLLPMLAYRILHVDPADPQFGLTTPELTLRVDPGSAAPETIVLGASSFTGAGFYARRSDDPTHVYLIARRAMNDLRSVAEGHTVNVGDPLSDKLKQAQADQAKADEHLSPYLRQTLRAGARLPDGLE